MNLTHLQYFLKIVEAGSVTKAAQDTFVSQSAISKMLKQLEDELGTRLFDRVGKNLVLNREGKLFYSYVSDSLDLLHRGIYAVNNHNSLFQTSISLLFLVASPLIPEIIANIRQSLPNVQLTITQHIDGATDLGQFDFIISTHPIANFENTTLIEEEILVGWNKEYFNLSTSLDINELYQTPFVSLKEHAELRNVMEKYCQQHDLHLNIVTEADEPATVRELILAGIGVGFIPSVSWHFLQNNIQLASLKPNPAHRIIYLSHSQQPLNSNLRIVKDILAETFKQAKTKENKK